MKKKHGGNELPYLDKSKEEAQNATYIFWQRVYITFRSLQQGLRIDLRY